MARPEGNERGAAGQDVRQPRCVVWLPPDAAAPRPLLHGLAARRVPVVLAHDPASVMRELAAARTGVLVITEPDRQPRLAELREAVARYHPTIRLWVYRAQGTAGRPQLGRFNGQQPAAPAPQTEPPAQNPPPAPPSAPSREPRSDAADDHAAAAPQPPPLSTLTPEELAMLLGPSPDPSPSSERRSEPPAGSSEPPSTPRDRT